MLWLNFLLPTCFWNSMDLPCFKKVGIYFQSDLFLTLRDDSTGFVSSWYLTSTNYPLPMVCKMFLFLVLCFLLECEGLKWWFLGIFGEIVARRHKGLNPTARETISSRMFLQHFHMMVAFSKHQSDAKVREIALWVKLEILNYFGFLQDPNGWKWMTFSKCQNTYPLSEARKTFVHECKYRLSKLGV